VLGRHSLLTHLKSVTDLHSNTITADDVTDTVCIAYNLFSTELIMLCYGTRCRIHGREISSDQWVVAEDISKVEAIGGEPGAGFLLFQSRNRVFWWTIRQN